MLGLLEAPTGEEVKAAYRSRAALLHPDVHRQAGDERRTIAATAAMQQLNDAYNFVMKAIEARMADEAHGFDQGRVGYRWRCPGCGTGFVADSGEIVICPSCGKRLRSRRGTTQAREPGRGSSDAGDREVVYSTHLWTAPARQLLDLVLNLHAIPHDWEGGDLVVQKAHESLTDLHVEQLEALVADLSARGPTSSEVCYSTAEWTRPQFETISEALRILGVRYYVEHAEVMVDKADERQVDVLVSVVTGTPPRSVQT